jgi:hypothetical protein
MLTYLVRKCIILMETQSCLGRRASVYSLDFETHTHPQFLFRIWLKIMSTGEGVSGRVALYSTRRYISMSLSLLSFIKTRKEG